MDGFFGTLNERWMDIKEQEPCLVDQLTINGVRQEKLIRTLTLTDPMTNLIMCRIRNPKIQISGFTRQGAKCIDLHKFMRETNVTPDFGFDPDDQIVEGDERDPWSYMSDIMAPKSKQRCLWLCIDEMNQVKRDYTKIMHQK